MATVDLKSKIGEERYAQLIERLERLNKGIIKDGIISYENFYELLTGYSYKEFFDWDLYFENLYLSYYGVSKFCRNNTEIFLDTQLRNGHISKTLYARNFTSHFKPFLAQVALLGSKQTGNYKWLREKYYNKLKKYLDCWFWFNDFDKNGLAVWSSADHTGMDNQIMRAGDFESYEVEGVDLNCYLYRELLAMAQLAEKLDKPEDAAAFLAHAEELKQIINDTFWDEEAGFYFDRNERTNELVRIKTIAGFTPLWAGIAPKDRAERLVREHLMNENEFWLPYPVATWSKDEPYYYQERVGIEANWRGPCWACTNYMIFQGLRKYGYNDEAWALAMKGFDMALDEPETREFYNSETGIGMGLNPFRGWSSLLYTMPLEMLMDYDPTDLDTEIRPIVNQELGLEFNC